MKTTLFTLLLLISLMTYSQSSSNQMRIDFKSVASYNPMKKDYNKPEEYPTSFIFDFNSKRDVLMISSDGEKTIFYTIRITNNLQFDDKSKYTEIDCVNVNGKQVSFILFDDIPNCMIMSDNMNAVRYTK